MSERSLTAAATGFTWALGGLSAELLGRPWTPARGEGAWREYGDNQRTVIFQVYVDLHQTAVESDLWRAPRGALGDVEGEQELAPASARRTEAPATLM